MIFAVVAGLLAAGSIVSGEKSRKQQKKASRNQEAQRRAQMAREKMAAVREQRIAQEQIVQGAATQGVSDSSAAQGGYSAIGSLTSGNVQFMNQMDYLSGAYAQHMQKANRYAGNASMFNSLANLSLTAGSMRPNSTTPRADGGAPVVDLNPPSS